MRHNKRSAGQGYDGVQPISSQHGSTPAHIARCRAGNQSRALFEWACTVRVRNIYKASNFYFVIIIFKLTQYSIMEKPANH